MRRFYQESWHGIPFTRISHLSFFRLAGSKFYSTFYEELFRRYANWDALPQQWRETKKIDARWLILRLADIEARRVDRDKPLRVLSIGSGVGYMEKILVDEMPGLELYVNEPSTVGLKWLRCCVAADRIYIGRPPLCLPSDVYYDMIYLSAVDYGISSREFGYLLGELRAQLIPGGELVCLSASLLEEDSFIGSLVNWLKICIRAVLHYSGVRRQQFWGWRRTRREYGLLLSQAGFCEISDGWLDDGLNTYWIAGRQANSDA